MSSGDVDAVGVGERADAPAAPVRAVSIEDQHGRVLALEDVDLIVRVRGHRACVAERLARGQLRPVFDELVRVLAGADCRHDLMASRVTSA
jgi:hypothetical protein